MNQRQYNTSVQDILHHLENIFKVSGKCSGRNQISQHATVYLFLNRLSIPEAVL